MENKTMLTNDVAKPRLSQNVLKLAALAKFLGLEISSIGKWARVSRPYASRVMNGSMVASSAFWKNLEQNLGALIADRKNQIFDIPAVDADKVEQLLKVG